MSFDMINLKNIRLFTKYLYARTQNAMVLRSASALSYTTLLAVVPFIVIFLSVFTVFPAFEDIKVQVQEVLLQYLMPDAMQNVQTYIGSFIGAAGKLTTLGALGIAVTAVLMLSTIESSFNFIFQVRTQRKIITKLRSYFFIIVICPLLLGAALYLKGYLLTLKYFNPENILGYQLFATLILPQLLTFGVLMLAYVVIPNKKVPAANAAWGALTSCLMMYILRVGFGYFLILNVTYRTIYGALATVPILLIWMYLWWTVVLSGAVFTASLNEFAGKKRLWHKQKNGNQRKN